MKAEQTRQEQEKVYLNNDNSIYIKEMKVLNVGNFKYILSKFNDYYIIEIERNKEVIKTINVFVKNKRVIDYEGCYFISKIIAKLLRSFEVVVPREVLK